MPKLTPSELLQIHEIASAQATLIAKARGYLNMIQDPDLETMVDHERRKAQIHYDELIEIAGGGSLDQRFENMDGGLQGRPRGVANASPKPIQPKSGQGFSDRTIAADLLSCGKNMAVRTIWAATESSHVGLRRALSEMSRYYLDAAYEFYRFSEQKGWYVPLAAGENATRWFQQNHEPMTTAGRQEAEWASTNSTPS